MAESFDQEEPLTIRLRGLLTEYPPGDSTLKELLQNADDAGARVVVRIFLPSQVDWQTYTVDTAWYKKDLIIDKGLAEHQGPSLLAYNNAVFTEEDFTSLKRLGDSRKIDDRMATGKFGLGFNSVYGWTDTPSILTGRSFVALSPHKRLSTPGLSKGLKIDFLNRMDLTDQLEAFKLVGASPDREFPGTVIRIPFRTEEQANSSEISQVAVKADEVLMYFEKFQADVAESLVFLKNVERVSFFVDSTELGITNIVNVDEIRKIRSAISSAILSPTAASCAARVEISQQFDYRGCQINSTRIYHVQQTIVDMDTQEISSVCKTWAQKAKLFPWVALAARVDNEWCPDSRIFVTLPLPIPLDYTRVNIHGMFALKRDRRSLWTDNDAHGGTTMNEIHWNNFMFKTVLPVAWQQLLVELTRHIDTVRHYFPLMSGSPGALWLTLTEDVLCRIFESKCPIWYSTTNQFLTIEEGFLVDEEHDNALLKILQGLSMPLFKDVPEKVLDLIRASRYLHTTLNPDSVRIWLRKQVQKASPTLLMDVSAAMRILEYICKDEKMDQLDGIPVFLCRDGQRRILSPRDTTPNFHRFNSKFYIGTEDEASLFDDTGERFLALEKYPRTVSACILRNISIMSKKLNIDVFDLRAFKNFCTDTLFSNERYQQYPSVIVEMSESEVTLEWMQKLWTWLDQKPIKDVAKAVHHEWLIPIDDGRTLCRVSKRVQPLVTQEGKGGEIISAIHKASCEGFRMVHKGFRVSASGYLRSSRFILDPIELEAVLCSITPEIVNPLPNPLRDLLRHHILLAIQTGNKRVLDWKQKLSNMPIFKKVVACDQTCGTSIKVVYSRLPPEGVKPVPQVPCVPIVQNVHFFDVSADADRSLFSLLGYTILSTQDLLSKIIIPQFHEQPQWLLDPLAEFIFSQANLCDKWISHLSLVAFITVKSKNGTSAVTRLKPVSVIDINSRISELFFHDEPVFASGIYADSGSYQIQMKLLGMKCQLDSEIAETRIKSYATRNPTDEGLFRKCKVLLELLNTHKKTIRFKNDWVGLIKLPAIKNGPCVLLPSQCRSSSSRPLVEGVLGIVPVHVEPFLEESFCWNQPLEPSVIAARIDVIVSSNSSSIIQAELVPVLRFLHDIASQNRVNIDQYISEVKFNISAKSWLPGVIDGLWPPERIFFGDARDFQPYLSELPVMYSRNFRSVLEHFGVQQQPKPEQLVEFIATLDDSQQLSERKLEAVVQALHRLHSDHPDFFSKQLMIPDIHKKLISIDEYGSTNDGDRENLRFAHPRVPRSVVCRLGIPQLESDLSVFEHLNGPNIFDYFQEENFVARISGIIKEATLWSSFNEFVANAEDCGSATTIKWILDPPDIRFSSKNILCDELLSWQTPALYIHNDGVFSEADFKALVNIGIGSKSQDSAKIGNYGLGALTMYVFTDIPSIISGEYFVIFDPTRQWLPFNQNQGRRVAGVRIPLAQMKTSLKGHLEPFVGIGGYSLDESNFKGTIFRFPIRSNQQIEQSPFKSRFQTVTYGLVRSELEKNYYNQASKSLVVLRNMERIEFWQRFSTGKWGQLRERLLWTVYSCIVPGDDHDERDEVAPFECVSFSRLNIVSKRGTQSQSDLWVVSKGYIAQDSIVPLELRKLVAEEHLIAGRDMTIQKIPDIAIGAKLRPSEVEAEYNYYNSLPLPAKTGFPVFLHSRFAITPDRRSLRLDSPWNKFLANSCFPAMYFFLLEKILPITGDGVNFYSLWPRSSSSENEISHCLHSSFWTQLHNCGRKLFANGKGLRCPLSNTIFDIREPSLRLARNDPILALVEAVRQFHIVVTAPKVIHRSLQLHSDQSLVSTIALLDPGYVRELLRDERAQSILASSVHDADLKIIMTFALSKDALDKLDGCWALRLDDKSVAKVRIFSKDEIGKATVYHSVDRTGYDLLKGIIPASLVNPNTFEFQNVDKSTWNSTLNVQPLNGSAVDRFVQRKLAAGLVKKYRVEDREWIKRIIRYSKRFVVDFHRKLPTIALSNDPDTFVSLEGCKTLPILPPMVGTSLQQIVDKVPGLYILSHSDYQPLVDLIGTWNPEERFLDCLYRLVNGNCRELEKILKSQLGAMDFILLRDVYVRMHEKMSKDRRSFTSQQIQVLRFLPLWKSARLWTFPLPNVSAGEALLIPSNEWIFPQITNPRQYVVEDSSFHKFIKSLGAKSLDAFDYLFTCVFPYLPDIANENQIKSIKKLLDFVILHQSGWSQSQKKRLNSVRLIPDRNGKLQVGSSLYDHREPVFEAAFSGDNTVLPNRSVSQIHLIHLGVNTTLTKQSYMACVRRMEREYGRGVPRLWDQAHIVWGAFVNRVGQIDTWTSYDLETLADCHFVLVDRLSILGGTPSYRDVMIRERTTERYVISTMRDVISPQYASIAWTQRYICAAAPPSWACALFDFSPSVKEVIHHLIELAMAVAPKCRITEAEFFNDLRKTYEYLNDPKHLAEAREHLQHVDEPIWLNEESSLDHISSSLAQNPRFGVDNIASLQWLPAKSVVHGVLFDLPKSKLYSAKPSIDPYSNLLRACGSLAINSIKANLALENVEDHGAKIFRCIKSMLESPDSLCDIIIVIEGRRFQAHRVILGAVSTYFRSLAAGTEWKECGTGVLDLDKGLKSDDITLQSELTTIPTTESASAVSSRPYGTAESVGLVIEWVYHGVLHLDDGNLEGSESVTARLDLYLDMLQLADVWDMPLLRTHVENRVLAKADLFIRAENVQCVRDLAREYNATEVVKHCNRWLEGNKHVVGLVVEDEDST